MRRFLAQRLLLLLTRKTRAAVVGQSLWRGFQDRRQYLHLMDRQIQAVRLIQAVWRHFRLRSSAVTSVVQLQSLVRGFLCRRRWRKINNSVLMIQAVWRSFFSRILYHMDLMDIVAVQRCARRFLAIREFQRRRRAVQVILRSTASYRIKRKLELDMLQRFASVVCQVSTGRLCTSNMYVHSLEIIRLTELISANNQYYSVLCEVTSPVHQLRICDFA